MSTRRHWIRGTIIVLVVLLLIARAALPLFVKEYVNRTLNRLEGYRGEIEDVDLALWRGAYVIKGAKLLKTNGKVPAPFLNLPRIDLSVQWRELFHGALVGELWLYQPTFNFVEGKTKEESQTSGARNWQEVVKALFPLKINHSHIEEGEIHFRRFESSPPVDVYLNRLQADIDNLTNSRKVSKTLVATAHASAKALDDAPVTLGLQLNPFADSPTFNLDASLEHLNLARLNDFLRAYAEFDVRKGDFSFYTELAADHGNFHGYIKPILRDVDVLKLPHDIKNPLRFLWEGVVSIVAEVIKNQPEDQLASRIPISGKFDDPQVGIWRAITSLLSNGFWKALLPGLENSVSLHGANKKEEEQASQ